VNPREMDESPADRNPLTADAYQRLRSAISSGELPPRERLVELVLSKKFSMSRTPVREAIQRLVSEGLAESGSDGVYVAALSVKDIRSLERVNRAVQSLAAEVAACEGSDADMEVLEQIMVRMEGCATAQDTDGWSVADHEMHRHIFRMASDRWLLKIRLQMEPLTDRVRFIDIRRPGRMEASACEHRVIVEAIKRRDGGAAYQAMFEHLVLTERNLVEILETFVMPLLNAGGRNGAAPS
jgi:GntR family transcriptional regulator, rspAB operon transcriptional repressor